MDSTDAKDCDPSKPAATQAMKVSVEVNSDANTEAMNYWSPDTPADGMTLSIDHIREQLFSLMSPKDLFNCRRLNRNWNSHTTVELQERFELKCTIKGEILQEYLDLLQKHQEIFPCLPLPIFRKYSFEKNTLNILGYPLLQQFLTTYGYFIRDLCLNQSWNCYSQDMLPKEKDVMEQVRSLLIHSAPNLYSLRMKSMRFKVDWKEKSLDEFQDSRPLRTTDPEFEEIHSIPDTDKNENLKFFYCKSMSGKIFELAVQLAPNLEEVQVLSPYCRDPKYFMEPLKRLRLCKDIHYSLDSSDLFKKFANLAQEGNLKLRRIFFMFEMEDPKYDFPYLHPEFYESYDDADVDAVNKILASSWDSLEIIMWRWVMEVPGLKWPGVMPNVSRINLGPNHDTLEDGLVVFPPDFSWSKTFPKLRELHFWEVIETSAFRQLLQCFKNQCIDSVEEVHVLEPNSEERDATTLANWEQLRRLFPSAQILSSWPSGNPIDSDGSMSP